MAHTMGEQDRFDWLRLYRTENVGPVTFYKLLQRYGSASAALDAVPHLAARAGKRQLTVPAIKQIETEFKNLAAASATLLCAFDTAYPKLLAAIDDAPPIITIRGHASLLQKPCLAIVGARNASLAGCKFAEKIARQLSEAGYTIISGLARGIDTYAHNGSLVGGTGAVLAGGIDQIYPPENATLYQSIAAQGIIIAENAPGYPPQARDFPRRNRIISGLALGTLVVEASLRSGSLITATYALDQGREVFAVPGSPMDPRAAGPNKLIKDGAQLVENTEDILQHLLRHKPHLAEQNNAPYQNPTPAAVSEDDVDKARHILLEKLSATPIGVDELVRECQIAPAILHAAIMELELAGLGERRAGGKVCLIYQ